jgi:hypothetical protein
MVAKWRPPMETRLPGSWSHGPFTKILRAGNRRFSVERTWSHVPHTEFREREVSGFPLPRRAATDFRRLLAGARKSPNGITLPNVQDRPPL